jgi:hypothetical protein
VLSLLATALSLLALWIGFTTLHARGVR